MIAISIYIYIAILADWPLPPFGPEVCRRGILPKCPTIFRQMYWPSKQLSKETVGWGHDGTGLFLDGQNWGLTSAWPCLSLPCPFWPWCLCPATEHPNFVKSMWRNRCKRWQMMEPIYQRWFCWPFVWEWCSIYKLETVYRDETEWNLALSVSFDL